MNLNEARATEGVPVLPDDDDDAVDPHLERIKNEAGGDDSDEEVNMPICHFIIFNSMDVSLSHCQSILLDSSIFTCPLCCWKFLKCCLTFITFPGRRFCHR